MNLLNDIEVSSGLQLLFLGLAVFRIYLEVIKFKFNSLPLSSKMGNQVGDSKIADFHRFGFYMSVGYFVLFAPSYLLS